MRAIGFSFTKLSAERNKISDKEIKISTDIKITDVNQQKSDAIKSKGKLLEVFFEYIVNYTPDFAKIAVEGVVLLDVDSKLADETLKQWKKKNTPEEFRLFVINIIMKKSTLKALNLSDELNLPLHVPFPVLRKNQQEN